MVVALLQSLVVCSVLVCGANAKSLRKGLEPDRSLQDEVLCKIKVLDGQFEDATSKELFQCFLDRDNDGFYEYSYMVDLPDDFVNAHRECIWSGDCLLHIPGGQAIDDETVSHPTVSVPVAAAISVEEQIEPLDRRQLAITGDHPTLVVRVTSADGQCSPTANDLAGSVFGLGTNSLVNNMAKQYKDCSKDQLTFSPYDYGDSITNGIVEVTINSATTGVDILSLTNTLYEATVDVVGNNLFAAKHVMYCLPYGTEFEGSKGWVAFANMNGKSSYYNNKWCDRLSSQMHEIGHNLGKTSSSRGICFSVVALVFKMTHSGFSASHRNATFERKQW